MCGICGELRFDAREPDLAGLSAMLAALVRRGPDHQGVYADGALLFGHRRLAIIDLSERSNQPMVDHELGVALVFNGVIYNYPELRRELMELGFHFYSDGDTEVIVKAYAAWAEASLPRLHGMFAFALWDMRQQRLLLARDRIGIKPLYYAVEPERLRFASNIQALLAAGGIDTSIDPVALHHHLTLHAVVPAPRTLLYGVRKVEPGTTVSITRNGQRDVRRYWVLNAQRSQQPLEAEEWQHACHQSLLAAVRRRNNIADVPVGVLLSGGLDSSLLVALLAETGAPHIKTFSVGFEDQPEERGSEFEYSDLMVERYGTDHHQYRVANTEVLQRLPEAVRAMAEPMVGQDAIAFYLLAEQVSREVKVVQSGQGADEVFAGYFWFPLMQGAEGSDLERFAKHYFDRSHEEYLRSVAPRLRCADFTSERIGALLAQPGADEFLDRVLRMDVTTLIVDDPVKRVDNMTMAWGLEARVPFLDHELVELAMQMPAELKLANGGKGILKRIARGRVPDAIIDRPKGYFPVPALKFVRGEFLEFMSDVLHSRASRERGLLAAEHVEQLLAEPEQHMTPLNGSKLWHAALLELWLQLNVDAAATA